MPLILGGLRESPPKKKREKNLLTLRYRSQPLGAQNQATALRAEGISVSSNAMGELMVSFEEFGWFPRVLPSEEVEGLEEESDGDEEEDAEG